MKKLIFVLSIIFAISMLTLSLGAVEVEEAFAFEEFISEDLILPYRLYVPEDYSAENEYPLVVFLHGAGERGKDNDLQLKNAMQTLFDRRDGLMLQSIVIAPQCPEGEQWVDTPWADGNYSTDKIPESNELEAVVALTKALCDEYSVDKARIYAMGVSMGGFGTWDLIIRHNDIFAGAAPMCGGGDPSKASSLVNTPIYTFHGTADASVPYDGTAEMVEAIEDESGRMINFITYDGEGHGIWEKASAEEDWLEWLYEQKLTDRYPDAFASESDTAVIPETNDTEAVSDTEGESAPESSKETTNENVADTEKAADDGNGSFPTAIVIVIIVVIVIAVVALLVVIKRKK